MTAAAFKAGAAYFAAVFAVGFALGAVRTLWLEPAWGETAAVVAELPVMLAVSWFVCARLVRAFAVPFRPGPRLAMGGAAFVLLMAAEAMLAATLMEGGLAGHVARYAHVPAQVGLGGQVVFALMPVLHLARR